MNSPIGADGTDKIQALTKLPDSWAELSEDLPLGLILLDGQGRLVSINREALQIFELNREKIVLVGNNENPTTFVNALASGQQEYWQSQIMMVLAAGEAVNCARYFLHTGYNQKILSYKISRIMPESDAQPVVAIVAWDVTEQVTREKYVILSEKLVARGEMASIIAGDLEKYLNSLSDCAELIKTSTEKGKTEAVIFNASAIFENIESIKKYIQDQLNFSEPASAFILYDTRLLIEDLLMTVSKKPRFRDVIFTIDLGADIPLTDMDVGQIQYVVKNLLNNAADTLEEKSQSSDDPFEKKISIEAEWNAITKKIAIVVTDNGLGISKEIQQKMYTIHFSTKKFSRGLGLYQCQKIVQQHDGELIVNSTVGEGSTFTLILPCLNQS